MLQKLKYLNDRFYESPSLLLGLCGIFWAGNAICSRLAVGEITPLMLVFLRWVLVLAVLWPLYGGQVRAHWPEIRPRLTSVIMMGALGFTAFNVLFYLAGHYTTALNIGILQGAMPIFVMAGAFLAHGTRVTLMQVVGVLITSVGVLVIATSGAPLAILEIEFNRGDLLMLAASVLYAFYAVALRKRPQMPGPAFFTLLALIAAVTSLPLLAFEALTSGLAMPTTNGLLVMAFVAIFPSCLAQLYFMRGVDLIGPGRAGVFMNLVPVFTAILAVVVLGEPFSAFHLVALVLVISGILLSQRTPRSSKP
jgi:drug/metabolite transporter (DMT)-like permease